MKNSLSALALRICFTGSVVLSLPACAAISQQQGAIKTEAQLQASAGLFLNAFYQGKIQDVLVQSGFPFYYNQLVFDSAPEWEMMLQQLFLSAKPVSIEIGNLAQVSPASIEMKQPGIWARLLEYKFHEKAYLIATIQVNASQPVKETVLLILDPRSAKIIGLAQ